MAASAQAVLQLRGHMVRRLPTRDELRRRRVVALTDRDRDLLRAVYDLGYLDMRAIEVAFFPATEEQRTSTCSAGYERLRQLWLWGFVDRIELPVAPSLGGRRPYLYTLGRRGVPVVASLMERGSRAVNRRRLDRLNDLEIEHDLKAALFWAMLRGYLETTWIERWSWVAERDLRAMHRRVYDREADRARPVLPDGEFWLHYPSGRVQWGMVEIDAGTLTLSRFRDKVRALSLWAESYLEKQPEGATRPDIGVYVVSLSEGRMAKLMEQAAKAVDSLDSWPPFYFATFDDLQPDAFPACWRQFDAKSYYLLYADAFEQPRKGA